MASFPSPLQYPGKIAEYEPSYLSQEAIICLPVRIGIPSLQG